MAATSGFSRSLRVDTWCGPAIGNGESGVADRVGEGVIDPQECVERGHLQRA
jgi:hypothetical protein